ncbi:hypothetical protein BGW42_008038 [Actinomortierella wolfii]|nr:hypothetical protein BGW42_008038 [Actinomortierella wolfii]
MSQSQSQQATTTMRPMTSTTTEASAFIASTSLSTTSPFNRRSSEEDPSSFVPIQLEPMSTSKKDNDDEWRNAGHNHHHGLTTVVTMHGDMMPSRMSGEQSYCPKHNRHDSCGGGANASHSLHSGGGGGRYTPSVAGSSNSVRTLLPGVGPSSSTGPRSFFGSLLVPWQRRPFSGSYSNSPISLTSSTATLIPPVGTATVSDVPSNNNNNNNHPDISPTGKVYMKRPKAKVLGGTAKDAASKTKGNGTRTALFSNERTFLHWIRFGILLGSLSLTLLNFGQPGSLGWYVGTVLLCIAMLVLVYASATFHFRDRLLSHKLKAQTLQLELRKQISSEPGALTAARIAEVSGTTAATGEAGPATIITVEQRRSKKKKGRESASTMTVQARIEKLKRRAEQGRYYDRIGPSIVTGALIIAYSFNLYLSVVNPPSDLLAHATGTSFFGRQ